VSDTASLEAAYGAPSQAAFGSAVFTETLPSGDSLVEHSKGWYRHFVGSAWERFGEDAWMGPWKEVHRRQEGVAPDIVAELRAIEDPDAALSVPMILDGVDGAEQARVALATVYDDPGIVELRVFDLGDGEAMSGLLVAGRRGDGRATFLAFLLD
jgi:hypothetical protein